MPSDGPGRRRHIPPRLQLGRLCLVGTWCATVLRCLSATIPWLPSALFGCTPFAIFDDIPALDLISATCLSSHPLAAASPSSSLALRHPLLSSLSPALPAGPTCRPLPRCTTAVAFQVNSSRVHTLVTLSAGFALSQPRRRFRAGCASPDRLHHFGCRGRFDGIPKVWAAGGQRSCRLCAAAHAAAAPINRACEDGAWVDNASGHLSHFLCRAFRPAALKLMVPPEANANAGLQRCRLCGRRGTTYCGSEMAGPWGKRVDRALFVGLHDGAGDGAYGVRADGAKGRVKTDLLRQRPWRPAGLTWHIPVAGYEDKVDEVARERGYKNRDTINVSREGMGEAYEAKIRGFFEEHMHEDEEIRYILSGSGFFDVRETPSDAWIRVAVQPGDLLVLPAGIYHRFTLDERDNIKALRLFQDEPKWIPHARSSATDINDHRVGYLRAIGVGA
ncbi:1,2-dihydroxy-3-keto-5-methylthiopentene dioxygenase [Mycena indigotica]|uniref:Acireductone dioxygenase n=1 Tax=Mycena indigotica TaxID=2126181 RepID=A0A8H6VSA9_9AGAR|nr:1,2-dihydroxy-3-keto-5-methylthiopentene dioxygenase [Mycena indigotica]KAF7290191.1 1,2-dihydroxy-3-keto-5-methylthiopentene dioxygenase [Mycena indigotica]